MWWIILQLSFDNIIQIKIEGVEDRSAEESTCVKT